MSHSVSMSNHMEAYYVSFSQHEQPYGGVLCLLQSATMWRCHLIALAILYTTF